MNFPKLPKVPVTHFEFDTGPFRVSHMREPRGFGSWAFTIDGRAIEFSPAMTYRDAKAWAKATYREKMAKLGAYPEYLEIKVLP